MAVSATSVPHQLDIEHLQTEHNHAHDSRSDFSSKTDDHDINDCHHCGHCSGNHTAWILLKTPHAKLAIKEQDHFAKLALLPINFPETRYRPPIA